MQQDKNPNSKLKNENHQFCMLSLKIGNIVFGDAIEKTVNSLGISLTHSHYQSYPLFTCSRFHQQIFHFCWLLWEVTIPYSIGFQTCSPRIFREKKKSFSLSRRYVYSDKKWKIDKRRFKFLHSIIQEFNSKNWEFYFYFYI